MEVGYGMRGGRCLTSSGGEHALPCTIPPLRGAVGFPALSDFGGLTGSVPHRSPHTALSTPHFQADVNYMGQEDLSSEFGQRFYPHGFRRPVGGG